MGYVSKDFSWAPRLWKINALRLEKLKTTHHATQRKARGRTMLHRPQTMRDCFITPVGAFQNVCSGLAGTRSAFTVRVTALILQGAGKETRRVVGGVPSAVFIALFRRQFPKSLLEFPFSTPL